MAYSDIVTLQIRDALADHGVSGLTEKRMMGGLVFLISGNMLLSHKTLKTDTEQFMFRVGKDSEGEALTITGTRPMIHGERRMSGFLFIGEADCAPAIFKRLLAMSLRYVKGLPPK